MSETLPKATHAGVLKIGNAEISCYVLEDGERILSTRGIMKSLGRTWRGRKYTGTELPVFLEAKNLKPLIDKDLSPVLAPVKFKTPRGAVGEGFDAEILPTICDIYLQAREDGVLTAQQIIVAKQCEILVRGFARIGIIALVDEATGYQDVRARKALEEILDKFIAEELRKWAKTFPDEFYKEIFRLKGWPYTPWSVKRPGVIGRYTNDIVYERLAPGVLEELRQRNPRNLKGHRKVRHHQWLTEDIGHPRLREHIAAVIALMRASTSWTSFHRMLQRALPRYGTNLELPFSEDDQPRVH
jgi:hypothetical protein